MAATLARITVLIAMLSVFVPTVPFSYIAVKRGQATFRSLADVSPDVLVTLRASIGASR